MSKPSGVPDSAIPIPPGGIIPSAQGDSIKGIQAEVARENTLNSVNWSGACGLWYATAAHNRDAGLPIPAKPTPPASQAVVTANDTDVAADGSGVIWLWIGPGVPFPPCPDLAPIVTPAANFIHIVRRVDGDWFAAGHDDTMPATHYPGTAGPPSTATSDDGVSGVFQKYAAPVGPGWYLKVG